MAIYYRVHERKNHLSKFGLGSEKLVSAQSKMLGVVTFKELAEDIANRCTLNRADVLAVLDALSVSAMSFLTKGFSVRLGELGSFSARLRCTSAPTREAFKPELIRKALVRYTPGVEMKSRLERVSFYNMEQLLQSGEQADESATGVGGSGGLVPGGAGLPEPSDD